MARPDPGEASAGLGAGIHLTGNQEMGMYAEGYGRRVRNACSLRHLAENTGEMEVFIALFLAWNIARQLRRKREGKRKVGSRNRIRYRVKEGKADDGLMRNYLLDL
ncbi:hypothetical protein M5K25_023130 [Dendrobium thyrsiflorum]|uniref:Uncharacterized protein n=1 Tax=Dendrobium thyrsiflorum TaxID=117978 RepID=A0ABD0U7Y1_DENTH